LTTGTGNTAVGYQAGATLTTSVDNTFIGYLAGGAVQTNTVRCVAVGREALSSATTYKAETVAIGNQAGDTSGQANAYVGHKAGNGNTGGDYNTGVGWNALKGFGTEYSTALGYSAGANSNGDYNVLLGANTGKAYNSTFSNTVAVGYQALTALTTGASNTAVGYQASQSLTTGQQNTTFGYQAGKSNINGTTNTFIGFSAGLSNTLTANTYVGSQAGQYATSNGSTGLGVRANYNADGEYNTGVGYSANDQVVAGQRNSAFGAFSNNFSNGSYNVAVGYEALKGVSSTSTFSNTVAVGYQAGTALTTGGNNILIGYQAGSTLTTESNKLYIENSNSTTPLIYGEFDNDLIRINGDLEVKGYADVELGASETFTIHDGTHDLFEVNTNTSGTLFSVNDVSGLPTFQSNDDGSAVLPKILTAAPTGTATEGTMQLGIVSGTCYLYVYINGGWKSTTLT